MANAFKGKGLTVKVLDVGRQDPGSFDHFGGTLTWRVGGTLTRYFVGTLTRRVGGIWCRILTRCMFSQSLTPQEDEKQQQGGK